ncbi:MAG TPA: DUF5915 domain-containing protein, partial [Solirubrobacteraceae bacterium]|nr:DUF5915 domain-containing protein [Solirubrobacteraceae bacterium]
ELHHLSGEVLEDPHRPFVDEVSFPCPRCDGPMQRVPEVIDVWFDSGAMPFAQYHAPHENEERFEQRFPADFVCEALDQTRGWFYSLLAESTLLFDRAPYKNVLCLGLILDEQGRKMSKSLGNTVEPWDVINRFGADAFRWYFFTSKLPWDGYRFSLQAIEEAVRQFLLQLWNTYYFYVLYANASHVEPLPSQEPSRELDRWALSRLAATVEVVRARLDDFDVTTAGRAIQDYIEELSNWYVRRSRREFWNADPEAFHTLRTCLVTVSKLLAPFCPFVADEIYDNLDGAEPSVHMCDFPDPGERDVQLEQAMVVVRRTVTLGLAARAQAGVRLRQPLRAAVVVATGSEREALERFAKVVAEELNVRELRFVSEADELGELELKPNYRSLGPRFGQQMPAVAQAVAGLDPAAVAAHLRDEEPVRIVIGGHEDQLGRDDLIIAMKPLAGYQVEREGSHAVALELEIDAELRREGWARDIVRAIQLARQEAGLQVTDRIALALDGDEELLGAAREHQPYIAGETLATEVSYESQPDGLGAAQTGEAGGRAGGEPRGAQPVTVDGRELRIAVALA